MPPQQRVALGMMRTFQLTSTFDNLQRGRQSGALLFPRAQEADSLLRCCSTPASDTATSRRSCESWRPSICRTCRDRQVKNLSLGEKRRLEIAMAILAEPKVLLLDEPLAGLAESEIKGVLDVLRRHVGQADDPDRRAQDFARAGFPAAAHRHARRPDHRGRRLRGDACGTRRCAEATGRSTPRPDGRSPAVIHDETTATY